MYTVEKPEYDFTNVSTQHTLGHLACPACREISGLKVMESQEFGALPFPEAAALWLESRTNKIAEKTQKDYGGHISSLSKFFFALTLAGINNDHIELYCARRAAASHEFEGCRKAGANCIRIEIDCILRPILRKARLWKELEDQHEPIKVPRKSSKRISCTPEEQEHLLRTAQARPAWNVAYLCAVLSVTTTGTTKEIRYLRVKDLEFAYNEKGQPVSGKVRFDLGAKNEYRVRGIPLNSDALPAAFALHKRAIDLGATSPDDFLLPHRAATGDKGWDFSRPMDGWRRAWLNLVEAAAVQCPRLKGMGFHCMRHTAISRLLDSGTPLATAREVAGWIGDGMVRRYYHPSQVAMQKAVDALELQSPPSNVVPCIMPRKADPCINTQNSPENSRPPSSATSPASAVSISFYGSTLRLK